MFSIATAVQKLRFAFLATAVAVGTAFVLTSAGVGGHSIGWRETVDGALHLLSRPESYVVLWILPALALFVILSFLHRILAIEHEGWRRASILVVGCVATVGILVALGNALDPFSFLYGIFFFGIPLLLAVLLLIEVIRWISVGFAKGTGGASD